MIVQRFFDGVGLAVEVAGLKPHVDAGRLALDRQHGGTRHGRGERLRSPHAAEPAGQNPAPGEIAAVVAAADFDEGLVGALNDPLAADIDPGPGGHLAVHHQPDLIERVEMVPVRPARHEVGIGDQHARSVLVGAEHAHRLAGLDQQRFIVAQGLQAVHDAVEGLPVAGGPADPAIDDQRFRLLRHLRVEVVHQHPQRRFGQPAFRAEGRSARAADLAGIVETGGWGRRRRGHGGWSLVKTGSALVAQKLRRWSIGFSTARSCSALAGSKLQGGASSVR